MRLVRGTACSVLLLVALAGCGGGSESASDTSGGDTGDAAAPAAPAGAPMPGAPGASGTIAAVTGSTAQLQGGDGQVAVSWTDATTFTEQVAGTLADVAVGSCVLVSSAAEAADGEPVAAASVRITEPEDGACTGGFGGGPGGERPEGMPTDRPADLPTDLPTDQPPGGGFGAGAVGAVTAVSAAGFSVESDEGAVEVTVDDATTYTATVAADASAAEVGRCASAVGDADDTGAVAATTVALSDPVDGECRLGGRGFGGGTPGQDVS